MSTVNSNCEHKINHSLDLGEFSRCFDRKLRHFIGRRVSRREDVEDLMQASYLEALGNLHKFRGDSKLETWLFGIANNLVSNHLRKLYRKPVELEIDEYNHQLSTDDDPATLSESQNFLRLTLEAFDELPMEMQAVLRLAVIFDMEYKEIAAHLGIPIGTVRSRLARARIQLKLRIYKN